MYIPKIYNQKEKEDFEKIISMTYGIFNKVIRHYTEDAEYRKLFGFPREIEELICVPTGYECLLPQARFDIFYHEDTGDFRFCEINADGAGAMNRQIELNNSLKDNLLYKELKKEYKFRFIDPIDQCIRALLEIYDTYEKKKDHPNIAVVDFVYDGSSFAEWSEFARRFREMGYQAQVCDIRRMKYKDGILYAPDGMPVDLIYRRAVTTDIIDHFDEVQDFVSAVRDRQVCVMGAFCTQVVHNKILFVVLHQPQTFSFLTPQERDFVQAHVPYTARLRETDLLKYRDREKWIIKPEDGYCCSGVHIGADVSQQEWENLLASCAKDHYIIQEMCPYEHTVNIDFGDPDPHFKSYINMSGLYVFGGRFGGVFHRQSDGRGIISDVNERSLPTLFID